MAGTPDGYRGREILDRVGDKWSVLVIALLDGQTRRFMDLRRAIPDISQRMLTVTLRHLERDGLVARTAYPTVPVTVEYRLTELGTTLLDPVTALLAWAFEHEASISAAREAYDRAESPRG
jgi:DNA-binding HxlR family transcriptional regulator